MDEDEREEREERRAGKLERWLVRSVAMPLPSVNYAFNNLRTPPGHSTTSH